MDHAFGSQLIVHLYRDVLGIERVDTVGKSVYLRFRQSTVESCMGRIPTSDGFVSLRWRKTDGVMNYQCDVPAGYALHVESHESPAARARVFPHGKVEYGYKIEGGYK